MDDSHDSDSSASSVDFNSNNDWITARVIDADDAKKCDLTYRNRKFIAKGTFGSISRILTIDRRTLAIKKIESRTKYRPREAEIMTRLKHPCVVRLKYHYEERLEKNYVRVFLVMEFMPKSLADIIDKNCEKQRRFTHEELAVIMFQMLRGLAHMHHRNIAHRDLKPSNVLVDTRKRIVKLCDFGSSKDLSGDAVNVTYVCTRWYRAPELLLRKENYDCKIDIWAAGCILAEMLILRPLFMGSDSVDQFACIKELLGTPTKEEFLALGAKNRTDFERMRRDLFFVFGYNKPREIIEIISLLLRFDPSKRPTAWEALQHEGILNIIKTNAASQLDNITPEELTYEPALQL